MDQLAMCFMHVASGALCMCSCARLFLHIEIYWTHHTEMCCVARHINYAFYTEYKWRISASANEDPFSPDRLLPFVHRPKGVLLV